MFTLEAHPAGLNTFCMTFVAGDPPRLATVGAEGVRVWDLTTRAAVRQLDTGGQPASSLTGSPDGRLLVVCQGDHPTLVRLWDWQRDRVVKEIDGGLHVQCALFAPDGGSLALGGYRAGETGFDYAVRRLRVATWGPQRLLRGHTQQVGFLAFSPDGEWLASGAADRHATLWNLATREAVLSVDHPTVVWGVAFSGDGSLLAATGGKTVKLIDTARRKVLRGQLRGHTREIRGLTFAPDGRTPVSAAEDGTVRWWDVATRGAARVLDWGLGPLNGVAFSANGLLGAASAENGRVVVWDVDE